MKRTIFRYFFKNNALLLPVLLYNNKPIAVRVDFVDQKKKTLSDYNSGWDKKYHKISQGSILRAISIRYAIENGLKIYDLRGGESYKTSRYGAQERFNTNTIITRNNFQMAVVKNYQRSRNIFKRLKNRI